MTMPNRKQYIILLALAVALVLLSLAIPTTSPLFAILTGTGCGGVASVIVAWLIDEANCRQNNQKAKAARDATFRELNLLFESSVQIFAHLCEQQGDTVDETSTYKWFEWIDRAFSLSSNAPESLKPCCFAALSFFNDISEEARVLRLQGAHLLDSGLVQPEDMRALSAIQTICVLTGHEYNTYGISQEFGKRCSLNVGLIKNTLDSSPLLAAINEKQVGITLYQSLAENHGIHISEIQHISINGNNSSDKAASGVDLIQGELKGE